MRAGWPPATQRVLLLGAFALLGLSLLAGWRAARTPLATPLPDDPGIAVRIDLNAAPASDLEALPGVGPALAARIVAHREAHGPFRSAADLERVAGVGQKLAARLRPLVSCDGAGSQ